MKFTKLLPFFLLLIITVGCTKNYEKAITPQIIPMPLNQDILDGEFILSNDTQIITNEDFGVSSKFLIEYLSDFNLKVSETPAASNSIQFIKDETISNIEGLSLIHI